MSKMAIIPAGSIFTVTTGEYNDYSVQGVFRAKVDIDAEALRDEWLIMHPDQRRDYRFKAFDFMGWVARRDLIEALDCFEWHLTDYARASEMDVCATPASYVERS